MRALVIFVAVLIVAVLTVGATAVRAVSRLWLRHWVERQGVGLGKMARHLERPTRLVHAAGTGATLVVFATGAMLTIIDAGEPWLLTRDALIFMVLLIGLGLFGVVFAINSSVHSYLILAYADADKVTMDVGFYYMANAGGRLLGTVLSGALFQRGGIPGCLWGAFALALAAALSALALPAFASPIPIASLGPDAGGGD